MALNPKISLSLGNKCNKLTITELTNPYTINTNDGGWGGPNISADAIITSVVELWDTEHTSLMASYNLTGLYLDAPNYPNPVEFTILSEATWDLPDGIYQVVYSIFDGFDTTHENELQHELFLCNLCNCKDSLVVKLIDACDTITVKKLKDQVDQMEIFIYGIQSAFSCGDFDTADAILTAATTYCQTLSDCGCGCGGC
jgi:hypothetical protein